MKSKLEIKTNLSSVSFPLLAESKDLTVVLFTSFTAGTVVNEGESDFHLGHYSQAWISCDNIDAWTILSPGSTVTLIQ